MKICTLLAIGAVLSALQAKPGERGQPDGLIGALRHVQLLEVTEQEPRTMRFATATLTGVALYERTLSDRSVLGEPDQVIELGFRVLPLATWGDRVPWRVLESGEGSWLVVLDRESEDLVVHDLSRGEEVARLRQVTVLEDARVREGRLEVLVRRDETLDLAVVEPAGGAVEQTMLIDTGPPPATACFVTSPPNTPAPEAAVVATNERGQVFATCVDLSAHRAVRVATQFPRSGYPLYVAARRVDGTDLIAIGTPMFSDHSGRVGLVAFDSEGRTGIERFVFPYGWAEDDDRSGTWATEYGRTLAFTVDADDDGHPDLAVGATGESVLSHVDIVTSAECTSRARVVSPAYWYRTGSSISVDPRGRYVLTGGGFRTYPELLDGPAEAVLIDVQRPDDPVITSFLSQRP
ncbi:MAG: hypothetical protein AAGA20_16885 [Planctomycetota bacterium]